MALKDILVALDNHPSHAVRSRLSAQIARCHGARLLGVYPIELSSLMPSGMPLAESYIDSEALRSADAKLREAAHAEAARIGAVFRDEAGRAHIPAEWLVAEGMAAELVTERARYADLAILPQADPDAPRPGSAGGLVETVLFGSGRPVLIVPYAGHFDAVGSSVLVAWTPTREAARAVNDALPFLEAAESVTVLSVRSGRSLRHGVAEADAEIARHLARHGVNAEAAATVVEDIDVGDAILSRAADLGSDLIVIGGYGHSRLREMILGGVTRALLEHMTVPVLMAH